VSTNLPQDRLVAALTQRLFDLVEPNTRFDRSSLAILGQGTRLVDVRGTQHYEVSFGTTTGHGKGRLGAGYADVGNQAGLQRHVEASLTRNRGRLPGRLNAWLDSQRALPGEPLVAGACFDGPASAGYDYHCEPCRGAGKVTCTSCNGSGNTTCFACSGSGEVTCSRCHGTAAISCSVCGGRGQQSEQVAVRRQNTADNREWTEYETVWKTCWSCSGRGNSPCSCGNGRQTCHHCTNGRVSCSGCGGSGSTTCASCDGTGFQHTTATITCGVQQSLALHAGIDEPEPKRVLESIRTLEELCALSAAEVVVANVGASEVARTIRAPTWLTNIRVRASDQEIELLGYGDDALVLDFKNVVGTLLVQDLHALEGALAAAPRVPWRESAALDAAIAEFLRSEVNAAIGNVTGAKKDRLEKFASTQLKGAVSSDYVVRAAKAIRASVLRTYAAGIVVPGVILAGVIALMLEVLTLRSIWVFTYDEARYAALIGFAAGFLFIELRARYRLKKRFPAELAPKVIRLLGATRATLWAVGGLAAGTGLATWGLGALVSAIRRGFA
jgi:hypothetical protein